MSARRRFTLWLVLVAGVVIAGRLNMFRRFDRPVRCSDGHLFTTIWIPGASLKAVRLGRRRVQRCPVGGHWTMVTSIDSQNACAADLEVAASTHDLKVP